MTGDIVLRLVRHAHINDKPLKVRQAMLDAADEIERLRAALTKIRDLGRGPGALDSRYAAIADNALAEAWDEGHSEHQDAHESGRPSRPNPYRRRDAGDDRR